MMKRNFLHKTIRPMMYIAILGLALTALTGCGIGHGPYRNGFIGYDGLRSGNDYLNNVPYGIMYTPDGGGYNRHMPGYGYGRGGYCGR